MYRKFKERRKLNDSEKEGNGIILGNNGSYNPRTEIGYGKNYNREGILHKKVWVMIFGIQTKNIRK